MDKNKFKRNFFFWVDKLQITRRERLGVTFLIGIICMLLIADIVIKDKIVPAPENHADLLAEFHRRSALIEEKNQKQEAKYRGENSEPTKEAEEDKVQLPEEGININTATIEEIQMLPGIGPAYAQRIVEYRETNDGFKSVDDLVNVRGIGPKTLEKLKPYIKL